MYYVSGNLNLQQNPHCSKFLYVDFNVHLRHLMSENFIRQLLEFFLY